MKLRETGSKGHQRAQHCMAPVVAVLGLPGAWAEDALETCSHYTTKVGGVPSWPPGAEAIALKEWLTCKACGQDLKLVVQAYAPVYINGRGIPERTLYMFGCVASGCGHDADSWRIFRIQRDDSNDGSGTSAAELDTKSHHHSANEAVASERCQNGCTVGTAEQQHRADGDERRPGSGANPANAPKALSTSTEISDVSNSEVAGGVPDELEGGNADTSNGAAVREAAQAFDADVRWGRADQGTADFAADDWGAEDASWGGGAADDWTAAGSALDMRALSEAIADAADAANKKSATPPEETADVSNQRVTSSSAVGPGDTGAGFASGAGRSDGLTATGSDGLRPSVLPCFYVVAGEEPGEKKGKEAQVSTAVDESAGEETWDGEGYEYDSTRSADRTFLRFRKRIERAPEQCLRYGFQSQPLLARALSSPPPSCPACGAPRTFEMQLMPPLAYFLAEASEEAAGQVAGWEWLTLLVFTCSKACNVSVPGRKSHHVAVQEEVLVYQHELEATKGH